MVCSSPRRTCSDLEAYSRRSTTGARSRFVLRLAARAANLEVSSEPALDDGRGRGLFVAFAEGAANLEAQSQRSMTGDSVTGLYVGATAHAGKLRRERLGRLWMTWEYVVTGLTRGAGL